MLVDFLSLQYTRSLGMHKRRPIKVSFTIFQRVFGDGELLR